MIVIVIFHNCLPVLSTISADVTRHFRNLISIQIAQMTFCGAFSLVWQDTHFLLPSFCQELGEQCVKIIFRASSLPSPYHFQKQILNTQADYNLQGTIHIRCFPKDIFFAQIGVSTPCLLRSPPFGGPFLSTPLRRHCLWMVAKKNDRAKQRRLNKTSCEIQGTDHSYLCNNFTQQSLSNCRISFIK